MGTAGLNHGLAFIAGILSFLSPCVLPLIPSYLALVGGMSIQELKENRAHRLRTFINTLFFVIGFSVVFITLGILLATTFGLMGGIIQVIYIIAGIIVIGLGVNFIFDFWQLLNIERRFHLAEKPRGKAGSLLFGMAFGAGWSPCIGPILGSILILSGTSGNFVRGLTMLTVYSLGLGLPFLVAGIFFSLAFRQIERIKPHLRAIRITSGLFLVAIGLLIVLGRLEKLNSVLSYAAFRLKEWEQVRPVLLQRVFGAGLFLIALLLLVLYFMRMKKNRVSQLRMQLRTQQRTQQRPRPQRDAYLDLIQTIAPVRIFFIAIFLLLAILSFSGVINFTGLLSSWFSFQGI